MQAEKKSRSPWLLRWSIAIPLGMLLGAPYFVLNYLSDAKDWGKNYDSYWDFAWGYWLWIALASLAGIIAVLGIILYIEHVRGLNVQRRTAGSDRE